MDYGENRFVRGNFKKPAVTCTDCIERLCSGVTLVRWSSVSDQSASVRPVDARVSTGNPELDTMLEGGLVGHRPYLMVGPSGTGKTTLALQFLCDGVRRGERVLLVTLEEPPNEARINHRGFGPELDRVDVFDAIPDIMRYERVPFKDIASVRYSQPFSQVPLAIRRSPELSAVEVTMAALEQMLRTEVLRKGYSRLVIDSLTALQYFCMKGFDPVAGAQAFLRFLADLRVTTILTVESPLEDVETPERALARGEIRLFRWELGNLTVRAIGVEKFRGSPHDVRLHPYRIGPKGIDINLGVTISRDTRKIIEPIPLAVPLPAPTPIPIEEVISPVDPLAEEVRDLVLVGADVDPVRTEIEAALGATEAGDLDRSRSHISRATALAIGLSDTFRQSMNATTPHAPDVTEAYQRIIQRGESARAGLPPTRLPPPKVLEVQLEWVLSLIPAAAAPPVPVPPPAEAGPSEETVPVVLPTEAVEAAVPLEPPPTAETVAKPVLTPAVETPSLAKPEVELTPVVVAASAPSSERTSPAPASEPAPPVPPPTVEAVTSAAPEAAPISPVPASAEPAPVVSRETPRAAEPAPPSFEPTPAAPPRPPAPPTPLRAKVRAETPSRPVPRETPPPPHPTRPSPHVAKAAERPPLPPLPAATSHGAVTEPLPKVPSTPTAPPAGARPAVPPPLPPSLPPVMHLPPAPPPTPVAPAAARRRRRAAPRRKSGAALARPEPPPSPAAPPLAPVAPAEGGVPVSVTASDLSGSTEAIPPKPRKRAARKRRAPPVVKATAGSIPPGALGMPASEPPSTEADRPAKEDE